MKKIKGFTLLELIIVMAVMTILMVGIMNMFRPIRAVYVDATLYESQRTAQNGMVQYITESTRYATNLALDNKAAKLEDAVKEFAKKLDDKYTWVTGHEEIIEVLYVDNATDVNFNNRDFRGRLYRCSAYVEKTGLYSYNIKHTDKISALKPRLALGSAYYGPYTYSISLKYETPTTDDTPATPTMRVAVSSLITNNLNTQASTDTDDIASSAELVLTEGEVNLLNVSSKVKENGIYNVAEYPTNNSTAMGDVTYILFTTDK